MRRTLLVALAVLVAVLPLVFAPQAANACVCAGVSAPTIEFEGEALATLSSGTLGRLWRFQVAAGRGVVAGDVVEVNLAVPFESNEGRVSSSCDIYDTDAPITGQLYRVGAYQGGAPDAAPRYFANQCGGYLQAVADLKVDTVSGSNGPPGVLFVVAGVALAAMVAITIRAARDT